MLGAGAVESEREREQNRRERLPRPARQVVVHGPELEQADEIAAE